jgi:hypothetical protein
VAKRRIVKPRTVVKAPSVTPRQQQPAAARPVGRPAPLAALYDRYGLVFDPQEDPVNQAEREAFRELYRSQVGREPDDEPDLRQASEQAGLLRGVGARGAGARRLRDKDEPPVFASAADALDYLGKTVKGSVDLVARGFEELVTPGLFRDTAAGRRAGERIRLEERPKSAEGLRFGGLSFSGVRGAARAVGRAAQPVVEPIVETEIPALGGRSIGEAVGDVAGFVGGLPTAGDKPGTRGNETIGEAARSSARAAREAAGIAGAGALGAAGAGIRGTASSISRLRSPFPTAVGVRGLAGGPSAVPPGARTTNTLGDVSNQFVDMSQNPNQYVDASSRFKAPINNAPPALIDAMAASMAGTPTAFLTPYVELAQQQLAQSPFAPEIDAAMKNRARLNGFDTAGWNQLLLEEKIFRATNENNYWKLAGRSLVRTLGEVGATPAGFKAIGEATINAAGGDTAQFREIIAGAVAPYGYAIDQNDRDGFWTALFDFARDNPAEFVLILNGAVRVGSRAGGVAARTGAAGTRLQEFAQPGRRITVEGPTATVIRETPSPERVADEGDEGAPAPVDVTTEPVRPAITVGFTGRGLLGNAGLLFVKRTLANRSSTYRDRLARERSYTATRLEGNIVQNIKIEIANVLSEALGRAPTEAIRQRVAWNLTRPIVMFDRKTRYTPAVEAAYYRQEVADLEASRAASGQRLDVNDRQQIDLWNEAARYMDELERVEVDPEIMARVREKAKPLGRQNDVLVAEALLTTPKAARRANYIRLLVVDPEFEIAAKGLKRRRNIGITRLVKTQRRVQRLSREILRYGDETGWGKYGQKRSRDAFEKRRSQLLKELRRGSVLALRAGDNEMAARFNTAVDELSSSRLGGNERRVRAEEAIAALDEMNLPAERLAELPEAARGAYERAEFAARSRAEQERVLGEARAEQAAALEDVGLRRVTEREVGLERQNVAEGIGDEARLAGLERALEASRVVKAEKLTLRQRAQIEKYAKREAERALRSGDTVLDAQEIRAALDVSERFAVVQIKTKREFDYYTMERARAETLDQFIARVEAADQQAVLHLVQTPAFERIGRPITVSGDRMINLTPESGGFVRPGRFKESQGYLFATAQESAKMWQNLLFDTAELVAAAGWRKKMQELVEATSIPFEFTEATLREAQRRVDEGLVSDVVGENNVVITAQQMALQDIIRAQGIEYELTDFVVINPMAPKALKPSERISLGVTQEAYDVPLSSLVVRELNDRTIDVDAPGRYYLMPRSTWDGIQKAIAQESYRITPKPGTKRGGFVYGADAVTRAWRTLTLNVLPRTAFNNFIGSTILAIQAGAGPRAFYYAAKALRGSEVGPDGRRLPIPAELRQRYFEQETSRIGQTKRKPGDISEPSLREATYSWIGWYMNSLRKINGMSEDFGRLAVWYSKAYPYAVKESTDARFFMERAKSLNDGAMDVLDAMARRDPRYLNLHEEWMRLSFDFLGDLHRGGRIASGLRIAIPFWQWYAHMLKLTFFTMPVKYPGRTLFLQQVAEIGAMYQQANGSLVPYGEDFVPFYNEMTEVEGMPQEVAIGISVGGWYPQSTMGEFGSRTGQLNAAPGALYSYVNPVISNSTLILAAPFSAVTGNAVQDVDNNNIMKAAKDEYGLEIDSVDSRQFLYYVFNKFFRMVPLSPTLMSSSGRASTALPFPGMMSERQYNSARLPGDYQEMQRSDLAGAVDDPRRNIFGFMQKVLGVPFVAYPGYGPIWRERLERDYEYEIDEKTREDAAVRDAIMELNGQTTSK